MLTRLVLLTVTAAGLLTSQASAAGGNPEQTKKLVAVLQSDAGLFEKARACQQLGEVGTPEAVPALAALLTDPHLSAHARSGLEGIADPSAAAALRAAVGKVQGNLLVGVVHSLGVRRDAPAVGALQELLAKPDSAAAKAALLALGRISTAESIAILRQILAGGPEALRPDAAAACLLAAEKQLADDRAETAAALYDEVRTAKVPAPFRAGATRGAILARKAQGVPLLITSLHSDERPIRQAALGTIREIPSDALANAVNAELEKAPPDLQVQLLTALVDCRNPQSLVVLRAKAASDDAAIRRTALTVLGRIGGAAEVEVLLKALADERSPEDVALAQSGLGRMEGADVDAKLVQALAAAGDAGLRVKLIRLVDSRGTAGAAAELLKQAAVADTPVRVAALTALKSLAAAPDLPALIALTKACQDQAVREAAENAVCAVCTRTSSGEAGGAAALAELKQAASPEQKNSWIKILAHLGYAPALPALQAALDDAQEAVAANALDQLGRWPDAAPIDGLLARVESGANPAQRKRALRVAIQLAWKAADEHQRPDEVVAGWLQRAGKAAQAVEERRLVLAGLGRVKHPTSLHLLVPYLDDAGLRTEAAAAVVQIAPTLAKREDTAALKETLEKIVATVSNNEIRDQAAKLVKTIPSEKQPVPLFDGKSLAGWEGNTDVWRVRDGGIVGGSLNGNPRNEFLATVKGFQNFVLRFEYKLVGTEGFVNGGVQVRSARVKQPPNEMSGYQADIGAGLSGCLYDESRRNKLLARPTAEVIKRLEKPGEWNRYEVRCTGPRIQLTLNGEQTVDYTEPDAAISQDGLIGLQIHGACKAEISFRNITILELPAEAGKK